MKRFPWLGMTVLVLAVASGCSMPPRPKKFNNMMARANQRLANAGKNFSKAIHAKPLDVSGARAAYTEMETALRETRKEFDRLSAPINSPPGEAMLTKYKEFLTTQQTILDQHIRPAFDQSQRPAPNWNVIETNLAAAGQKEATGRQELKKAQDAFCKHHVFEAKTR